MKALHILLSGRVQGVGFRWFAEREAERRALSGYVRNLPDGRVEVLAQGEDEPLQDFCARLRRGPAYSEVLEFATESVPVDEKLRGFRTRF